MTDDMIVRFWRLVEKRSPNECWPWKGAVTVGKLPYPVFCHRAKGRNDRLRGHRLVLFLKTGKMGAQALHSCDNTLCCNPRHLRWGDAVDNVQDMVDRGRVQLGAASSNAKLTEPQVKKIRRLSSQGVSNKHLAKRFRVARCTISHVIHRRNWSHL